MMQKLNFGGETRLFLEYDLYLLEFKVKVHFLMIGQNWKDEEPQ